MTRAVAAAVFLACLAVNVRRLCPDIFPDDSPETVTACLTLGIGHPPGDPLMNLTGRLALALPVGGPAFRINVLAAALAAGLATGAWLLTARAMVLPLSRFAAAAAAIALVVSNPVLAQQAAVAKGAVYGWNLLLLLGTAAAVLSGRPLSGALAAGVLLGHHWMTFAAFAPILLGWGLFRWVRARPDAGRRALLMVCVGTLGASLWLTLPVRAAARPAMNTGDAETLRRFVHHVTRKPFLPTELSPRPASIAAQAVAGTGAVLGQLGIGGLLLGVAGISWLMATEAAALWVPVAAALGGLAATSVYLHLPRELFRLLPVFLLPCWLFAALVALRGAAALAIARPWQRALAVLLVVAAPILQQVPIGRSAVDRCFWSADLGRALLAPLPRNAGLVLVSDLDTFPVWERQMVWHDRPDVAVVNFMLLRHPWYRAEMIRRGAPAALASATTREAALALVLRDRHREWFSATVPLEGTPASMRRIPFHLSFHLTERGGKPVFPRGYAYRGLFERFSLRPEPSAMLAVGYTMECLRNLMREGMPPR